MEQVISHLFDYSISVTTLAVMVYLLYYQVRLEKKERQHKDDQQNALEKEFREYLMNNQKFLYEVIQENSEALNRNAHAFELFSKLFEEHTKNKKN
jgi:hypothetical protein